jgi:hypothetical protein
MSDISPEDRERLVKGRFKELLHEMFEEEYNDLSEKRRKAAGAQQGQGQQQPAQQQQIPGRKRSLFEEVISNTLGMS